MGYELTLLNKNLIEGSDWIGVPLPDNTSTTSVTSYRIKGDYMTGFFTLVPFEDNIYLVKATESQPLTGDSLEKVNEMLDEGKSVSDIQEQLHALWNA